MARSTRARQFQLPAQVTPLIGRAREVQVARGRLLDGETRLLTFTGPAGIGKTRMAVAVAAELGEAYAEGAWFVDLAPIVDPTLVAVTIARTLGLREATGKTPAVTLKEHLRETQTLLVLDNFEQVTGAAPLVAELLAECPELALLVTSRAPLHIYGEHEFAVPPLAVPSVGDRGQETGDRGESPEEFLRYGAVALFVQRARAVRHEFQLTAENVAAVAELCARLDGIPLAIELAAARSKLLSPATMLTRLEQRLTLLAGDAHGRPARHQTLRGAINWSHDLLTEPERTLFRRLGIFAGGWTAAAAAAVAGPESKAETPESAAQDFIQHSALSTQDLLESLADKSLLHSIEPSFDTEPRFTMLESVRAYAHERLVESGELEAVSQRHAGYFLELAQRTALMGPQRAASAHLLDAEHDNLRAALRWLTERGDAETAARMTSSLWWMWARRGHVSEGRSWHQRILSLTDGQGPRSARMLALQGAGALAWYQGEWDTAQAHLEEAAALSRELEHQPGLGQAIMFLALVEHRRGDQKLARALFKESLAIRRALGDRWGMAMCLTSLAGVPLLEGDYAEAQALEEESAVIFRELDDRWGLTLALQGLGRIALDRGDLATARACLEEGLTIRREVGDLWSASQTMLSLGHVALAEGNHAQAAALFEESLSVRRAFGNKQSIAECLAALAGVAAATGRPERAARLFGAAGPFFDVGAATVHLTDRNAYERNVATVRELLGEERFTSLAAEGAALSLEQAIQEGLTPEPVEEYAANGRTRRPLTKREQEVAVLIARGLTNRQIAAALTISEGTVGTHVEHMLEKLGVQSRAQVAVWVVESGLHTGATRA